MATVKNVSWVQFSILTTEEIIADGIKIDTPTNRSSSVTKGTPYDPRMGTLDKNVACEFCGKGYFQGGNEFPCPGHFGYIMLAVPCYNPEYLEYVAAILRCICHKCSKARIPESLLGGIATKETGERFRAYKKKAETVKQCYECKEVLATFTVDGKNIKMFFDDKSKAIPVSASEARTILGKISSEDTQLMGLNSNLEESIAENLSEQDMAGLGKIHLHEVKPKAMIIEALPVPHISIRPWVIKGSERKDDDLTDLINTILKYNLRLETDTKLAASGAVAGTATGKGKRSGKLTEAGRREIIECLHTAIWTLFDNSKQKSKNANRKPKGLRDRLIGKGGHSQDNVGGKRVDFTARTVIVGAGAMAPMDCVGIPKRVARTFTIPDRVLEWNFGFLTDLLNKGLINQIVRKVGKKETIANVAQVTKNGKLPFIYPPGAKKAGLQLGDICFRQLLPGDYLFINRQPSLRTESFQGVSTFHVEEDTIRFPMAKTRAYNADQRN